MLGSASGLRSRAALAWHSRLHVLTNPVFDEMFVVCADAGQNLCPRGPPYPKAVEELQACRKLCCIFDSSEDTTQDAAVLDGLVGTLPTEWKHLEQKPKVRDVDYGDESTWPLTGCAASPISTAFPNVQDDSGFIEKSGQHLVSLASLAIVDCSVNGQ